MNFFIYLMVNTFYNGKFNNSLCRPAGVMVIIKRDDYISFLNSTGVKIEMPTTPVTINEITLQPPPGNGNLIPANNNSNINVNNNNINNNNASNIATIKRDNSQQQLQQLQAYTQMQSQQQQIQNNQNHALYAKAQLICRPNSHPFQVSN